MTEWRPHEAEGPVSGFHAQPSSVWDGSGPPGDDPQTASSSYLGVFSQSQRVFDIHPKIAHSALDLRVTQQSRVIMRIHLCH